MSARLTVVCKQCPLLRRGLNYIIMGQVGEDGRGKIMPNSFIMMFKTKNQKLLNALKTSSVNSELCPFKLYSAIAFERSIFSQ